jgi:hypothetical protein
MSAAIAKTNEARLVELAKEINAEVVAAESEFRSALDHAVTAGEKLIEAKGLLEHGGWLSWLKSNFPLTRQMATNYMRLAKYASNGKYIFHSDTVVGALAEVSKSRLEAGADVESTAVDVTPTVRQRIAIRAGKGDAQRDIAKDLDVPIGTVASVIHADRGEMAKPKSRAAAKPTLVTIADLKDSLAEIKTSTKHLPAATKALNSGDTEEILRTSSAIKGLAEICAVYANAAAKYIKQQENQA